MKFQKLSIKAAKAFFAGRVNTTNTYVVEWKDRETGEVYNVSGKPWKGSGPGAGQMLKYVDFLLKKADLVRSKKTNSRQFYKFIMEQNDGGRDRGTGFAAKFPNGVELDVVADIYEFTHPLEAPEAAELYNAFRKNAKCITRAKFLIPEEAVSTATIIAPQADFTVEPGLARNLKIAA
jgi:hypothetical protein